MVGTTKAELPDDDPDQLLAEYETCLDTVWKLEANIWQTSSIIGVGSIGTLIIVVGGDHELGPALSIGLIAVVGVFIWWSIAKRWWSAQHVRFTRMLHIEQALRQPGQVSYMRYLDDLKDLTRDRKKRSVSAWQPRRYRVPRRRYSITPQQARDIHRLNWPNYQRRGPRDVLRYFPWTYLVAWILLAVALAR